MQSQSLDSPERVSELKAILNRKFALRMFYLETYKKFAASLNRSPSSNGNCVELGSGGGFIKTIIPEMITSDILPYPGLDMVVDGTRMPFADGSVRFFSMLNVLHHVSDPIAFFTEINRCLMPGGRVFITDQHAGRFSQLVFKYLHHEPFDKDAVEWKFESSGPLSGANGALTWIIFQRDKERFSKLFPHLNLLSYQPHSALIYWLSGGLKSWSLAPKFLYSFLKAVDNFLVQLSPGFASFTDVEIEKSL